MDGVAVSARAGMNTDILALFGRESCEDFVIQVDKGLQQRGPSPGVARVIFRRQPA